VAGESKTLGVVIAGGNGFLGSHLARSLRKRARVALTFAKNRVPIEGVLSIPLDVRDVAGNQKLLRAQRPDVVVYLGGPEDSAWVDANPKLADKVFVAGLADLIHASEALSARFIYVSSASVFDGTKGNYSETDHISPMTLLGKLKANGETLVRGRVAHANVLRLSSLVGSSHPWRPSLFDRIRIALESGTVLELRNDEYHSWTSATSAVTAIEAIIDQAPRQALFNFGGLTRLTPLEMAKIFARTLGYSESTIEECLIPKKRTLQKGMVLMPDGENYDFSLNSSAIIRELGVKTAPIETEIQAEFAFPLLS